MDDWPWEYEQRFGANLLDRRDLLFDVFKRLRKRGVDTDPIVVALKHTKLRAGITYGEIHGRAS
jgi:hypothetical protein